MAVKVSDGTLEGRDAHGSRMLDSFLRDSFLSQGALIENADGSLTVGYGSPTAGSHRDEAKLSVYAPDFLLESSQPWMIFPHWQRMPRKALLELLQDPQPAESSGWSGPDFDDFSRRFQGIQDQIAAGNLTKAVPVVIRRSAESFKKESLASAIQRAVLHTDRSPLKSFGLWTEAEGILGMTPERLFEIEPEGTLKTMALAGTRSNLPGTPSLLDDPKEVHEHQIVVEGIENRLSKLGTVAIGPTSELTLPTLTHLHTPISATPFKPTKFEAWVEAIHPTPALGAWPEAAGRQWILADSGSHERLRHGAPFAVFEPNAAAQECLVAIRCLQWNEAGLILAAGCGIVKGSQLNREWAELQSKIDAVRLTLGL